MTNPDDGWAGERVARWLRQAPGLERQMQPVADVLFEAAAIEPGEAVLDVGCGTGPTTRAAAALGAHVTGLDVSGEMLAAAAAASDGGIEWVEADAVTWTPPPAVYDVVISRFGTMFFSDPPRALANLATATRPGGRLAVAVWARRDESPLFAVPYHVALELTGADPLADDEGPFGWHDAPAVAALLEPAGWRAVAVTPHRLRLPFAGGLAPAAAAEAALDFGLTRTLLEGSDEATAAAVRAALAAEFAEHVDDTGLVVLDASVLTVTAQR